MARPRLTHTPPESASPSRIRFAEKLRAERTKQGLSLEELADKSGLTWSYISEIERCRRSIGIDKMDALAMALGVELRDLL